MKEFLNNLSMKYKIAIIIGMLIIIIVVFGVLYKYYYIDTKVEAIEVNQEINSYEDDEEELGTKENISSNSRLGLTKEDKKIIVHIIGEVKTPGVVTLEEGSRIIDAINMAGGTTEDADLSKINLAYIIEDGVQIYVPRVNENTNNISYINQEAGEGIILENESQEEGNKKEIKVNINTANLEKLQTIPGVGAATAQKILDYRKENGKFKTIEDIKNVNGIGESKFNNLKEYITIK